MNLFITGSNGYIGRNFIKIELQKKALRFLQLQKKKKNKKNQKCYMACRKN